MVSPGYGSIPKEDIISWKKSLLFRTLLIIFWFKHHTADGVEDGIFNLLLQNHTRKAVLAGRVTQSMACGLTKNHHTAFMAKAFTRTNKYGQFSILTFTLLMGMSDVVTKFLKNPSKSQKVVNMTIYDAGALYRRAERANHRILS